MKNLLICTWYLFVASISVAQTNQPNSECGIYKNWEDYKGGKLVLADKIYLNQFTSSHYIDISKDGKRIRYHKDSIFGYKDKDQKVYRFYKSYDEAYEILESRNLVIYVIYEPLHTPKGIAPSEKPVYFFSTAVNSKIEPLTINNLKQAYPDNHEFHHDLDDMFGDGTSLSTYDNQNKIYKINYLLNKYLKQ